MATCNIQTLINNANCFSCLSMEQLQAILTSQYCVKVNNMTLVAPVLEINTSSSIKWTWTLPDPPFWRIDMSTDGGATWSVRLTRTGNARLQSFLSASASYRITGVDGSGESVTLTSNVVVL